MDKGKDNSLAKTGEKGEPIFLKKHLTSERACTQCGHRFLLGPDTDDLLCPSCLSDYYRMVAEE